ncbi:hypothetical protein B0A48_12722 [Cryoendolithus antarcticus]|uniref:Uncharacterized protein n=1 Tax=Cryoendolithus antarcticus TaxID=1507870 RepID=A0A1V8SR87_9PEZI|nr:hypothetical protein B0A48_12722 [Cryoendolithus antarcticus]
MADTTVSSSILAIIGSFASGLDVFKKLREKRRHRRRRVKPDQQADSSELRLSRSLRQGPEDIGREYQSYAQSLVGERVAAGDAIAQNLLAEILLRLNGGLVGIITSFLGRKDHDRLDLDYRSLTDLSEQSRHQTVGVLRGLYQRMLSRRSPRLTLTDGTRLANDRPKKDDVDARKHAKIRGPTLARVVVQDSKRPAQLAIVRPTEGRRKSDSRQHSKSRSTSDLGSALSRATTAVATDSQLSLLPPMPSPAALDHGQKPRHRRAATTPTPIKPSQYRGHPPDLPLHQPTDALRPSKSTSRLPRAPLSPPALPEVRPRPSHTQAHPDPYRRRKETPTFYSSNSGSTKLGEIPMHKWPVPYDWDAMSLMNKEAMASGWPQVDDGGGRKKKGGFLGMFRRRETVAL